MIGYDRPNTTCGSNTLPCELHFQTQYDHRFDCFLLTYQYKVGIIICIPSHIPINELFLILQNILKSVYIHKIDYRHINICLSVHSSLLVTWSLGLVTSHLVRL